MRFYYRILNFETPNIMNITVTIPHDGRGMSIFQLSGINFRLLPHEEFSTRLSIIHNNNDVTIIFIITGLEFFSLVSHSSHLSSIQFFFNLVKSYFFSLADLIDVPDETKCSIFFSEIGIMGKSTAFTGRSLRQTVENIASEEDKLSRYYVRDILMNYRDDWTRTF